MTFGYVSKWLTRVKPKFLAIFKQRNYIAEVRGGARR